AGSARRRFPRDGDRSSCASRYGCPGPAFDAGTRGPVSDLPDDILRPDRVPYLPDPVGRWKSVREAQAAERGQRVRVTEDVDAAHASVDDGEAEDGEKPAVLVAEDRRPAVEIGDDVAHPRRHLLLDGEEETGHRRRAAERSVEGPGAPVAPTNVGGERHVVRQQHHQPREVPIADGGEELAGRPPRRPRAP